MAVAAVLKVVNLLAVWLHFVWRPEKVAGFVFLFFYPWLGF
jgi:hypothetical protein